MSTTALNGMNPEVYCTTGIMPRRRPDVRRIVREEIERQKKLDELEQKYKNGEISKFEYTVGKLVLNGHNFPVDPVIYSNAPTVEYMA